MHKTCVTYAQQLVGSINIQDLNNEVTFLKLSKLGTHEIAS